MKGWSLCSRIKHTQDQEKSEGGVQDWSALRPVGFTLFEPLIEQIFFWVPRKYLSKTCSVSEWGLLVPLLWDEERALVALGRREDFWLWNNIPSQGRSCESSRTFSMSLQELFPANSTQQIFPCHHLFTYFVITPVLLVKDLFFSWHHWVICPVVPSNGPLAISTLSFDIFFSFLFNQNKIWTVSIWGFSVRISPYGYACRYGIYKYSILFYFILFYFFLILFYF